MTRMAREQMTIVEWLETDLPGGVLANLLDEPLARGVAPEIWDRVLRLPLCEFFNRPGKQFRARVVEAAWSLVEPIDPPPASLPLIVELIHAGSLIVDDIQDNSTHRRGKPCLHQTQGVPIAINCGNALYFVALSLVERIEIPPPLQVELYSQIVRAMLSCHHGQALDLGVRVDELDPREVPGVVAAATELKTGRLMELAARIGGLAAGANSVQQQTIADFGLHLGIGLQMLNDLADLSGKIDGSKRHEDLRSSRPTWPWAWLAESLGAADYERLRQAQRHVIAGALEPSCLAEEMLTFLHGSGRRVVQATLREALDRLKRTFGPSPNLELFELEIVRLERSYG